MSILEIDSKGRLTLPKKIREFLDIGKKVLIINAGDHLKIIPLPSDPLRILHGAFNVKTSEKLEIPDIPSFLIMTQNATESFLEIQKYMYKK